MHEFLNSEQKVGLGSWQAALLPCSCPLNVKSQSLTLKSLEVFIINFILLYIQTYIPTVFEILTFGEAMDLSIFETEIWINNKNKLKGTD